jgi:hypothetical protein
VGPAKEAVAEVAEEDSAVEAVAEVGVEAAEVGVEVADNQQQQQQHRPTHLGTDLKGYHPPYFKEIPSYSTRSNKNGDCTGLPTSITTI